MTYMVSKTGMDLQFIILELHFNSEILQRGNIFILTMERFHLIDFHRTNMTYNIYHYSIYYISVYYTGSEKISTLNIVLIILNYFCLRNTTSVDVDKKIRGDSETDKARDKTGFWERAYPCGFWTELKKTLSTGWSLVSV